MCVFSQVCQRYMDNDDNQPFLNVRCITRPPPPPPYYRTWKVEEGRGKKTKLREPLILCGNTRVVRTDQPTRENKQKGREGGRRRGSLASTTAGVVKDPPPLFLRCLSWVPFPPPPPPPPSGFLVFPWFDRSSAPKGRRVYLLARHSVLPSLPRPIPKGEGFGQRFLANPKFAQKPTLFPRKQAN